MLVMLASCFILVGLSYYLLNLFSGMVLAPRTPVEEREERGELLFPLEEDIAWMEASLDGRFLAAISGGGGISGQLMVLDLEEGGRTVWAGEMRGRRAHWVGASRTLAFEDRGDILALDLETGKPELRGLATGPEFEEGPLPSPDGRYILYKSCDLDAGSVRLEVLNLDNGEERSLGAGREPAAWDPTGTSLVCLMPLDTTGEGKTILQEADVSAGAWVDRYPCEEKARFLWWPEPGELYYVAPYRRGEETWAVWFLVKPSGEEEKKASTDSLEDDLTPELFVPMRGGPRLAYWGAKGLEILDIRRKSITRYPHAGKAGSPLAWRESAGEILWWEPSGIYRLELP
ncbi:MAG: TolB family protein [Actinomycetota bacterium]